MTSGEIAKINQVASLYNKNNMFRILNESKSTISDKMAEIEKEKRRLNILKQLEQCYVEESKEYNSYRKIKKLNLKH